MIQRASNIYKEVKPFYKQDKDTIFVQPTIEPQESKPTTIDYQIKSGDMLGKIARDNGITLDELLQLNPQIQNPNKIRIGQNIKLPIVEKLEYQVKQGDTLGKIAKEHNMSIKDVLKLNPQITNPNLISVNQTINLGEKKYEQ